MKNVITLLLVLVSPFLYAQNLAWDSLLYVINQPELETLALEQFLARKKIENKKQLIIYTDGDLKRRQLGQSIRSIHWIRKREKKKVFKNYTLNYLSIHSKVIYVRLFESKTNKPIIEKSTPEFEKWLSDYLGNSTIAIDQNHKYFNPSENIYVGFGCGISGEPSKQFYEMEKLVLQENKKEILHWCRSISPEIRCLGAIGLSGLKIKGVTLREEEHQILNTIAREKTMIYTCSGCTDWGLNNRLMDMFAMGKQFLQKRIKQN